MYLIKTVIGNITKITEKEGYAIAISDKMKDVIENKTFKVHMKDILEYRTMEYYRRRYRAKDNL